MKSNLYIIFLKKMTETIFVFFVVILMNSFHIFIIFQ